MSAGVRVTPSGRRTGDWDAVVASTPTWTLGDLLTWSGAADGAAELLVVSAHPDDETIGAGRLLAAWTDSGRRASALLATAGEACVDHVGPRPPGLAARRLREWHAALDALAVDGRAVLALRDGHVAEGTDDLESAVVDHARELNRRGPVLLVAPYDLDPHPDHRAAGRAAAAAAEALGLPLVQFPVWMGFWSDPGAAPTGLRRLVVDEVSESARTVALAQFRSQLEPLHPGLDPVVPAEMLEHHRHQLLVAPTTIGVP